MIIEGTIVNDITGSPIVGASILVPSADGSCREYGKTDVSGRYLIDVPNPVAGIVIKQDGYQAVLVEVGSLQQSPQVGLQPVANTAGGITTVMTQKKIPWLLIIAGGGLILMSNKPQQRRVGAAGYDYGKLLLPGAAIVAGFLILKKFGLIGPSGPGTGTNNAANQQVTAATQTDLNKAAQQGITQTLSANNAASIANDIFANATSSTGYISQDSQDRIISDLTGSVANVADYLAIKLAFGTRASDRSWYSWCGLFNVNCSTYDLDTTIKNALDADHVSDLHNFLATKGYNF